MTREFKICNVLPGRKNMIQTHSLYQVGRELQIVGTFVDWDMETIMSIILVSYLKCHYLLLLTLTFLQVSSVSLMAGQGGACLSAGINPSASTLG